MDADNNENTIRRIYVHTLGDALEANIVVKLVLDDGLLLKEAPIGTRRLHDHLLDKRSGR